MMQNAVAMWLNILTIATMSFMVCNLLVSGVVATFAQRFITLEIATRKRILWLCVCLPWVAVLCVIFCFIYPYYTTVTLSIDDPASHWYHLNDFVWFSWNAVILVIAVAVLLKVIGEKLLALVQHKKELALLSALSEQTSQGVFVIPSPLPSAFTCGFIAKRCYITTAVLDKLTLQEQAVVLRHEQAHAKAGDPFKKWCFSVLSGFFIPVISKRLTLQMTLAMEQGADEAVLSEQYPATLVASTLVKMARLNQKSGGIAITSKELVTNFAADVLSQRVYFLLGKLTMKPANKLLTTLCFTFAIFGCFLSIDGIHHLMETLFNH